MARRQGSSGEKTAREIRSAALRLFAAHGYAAVSMRQIAREVGVQAGALYLYISDKQALLAELMIDHLEDLLTNWEAHGEKGGDPRSRLEAFVRFHIRYHLDRVDEVFIAYMELRNLEPENFQRVERLRRMYETVLGEILQDGVESGDFQVTDPRIGTLGLIAMLTGITTWYRGSGRLTVERIEEIYIDLVFRAVGAR